MNYVEYVTASLAKDTIGAKISVALFALVGIYVILGIYFGIKRGFTKSLIRFFTVGASAIGALIIATMSSATIVKSVIDSGAENQSVIEMLGSYSEEIVNAIPEFFRPLLGEISAETAVVFVMMFVAIAVTPVLFVALFYAFRILTMLIYTVLGGLSGAIGYGKGSVSTLLGAAVGLAQGLLISAVIIIPVSGLCDMAVEARSHLINDEGTTSEYVLDAYEIIDDVTDNPLFELVDKFSGNVVYEKMITVTIGDHTYNMADECIGALEIAADLLPLAEGDFNWKHPTEEQKAVFESVVDDVAKNELFASLTSDVMHGMAASIQSENIDLGLSGAPKALVNDVMNLFRTAENSTISGDMHLFVDIYMIMCDRNLMDSFVSADSTAIRDALTTTGADGRTAIDVILSRLNEYDRAQPIVTSFTKLSLTVMMGTTELDEDTQKLYDDVKEDITTVLNHNKSDFETEEEYKEAVSEDLDKALSDNNIEIEEEVKDQMVDYIAENYGDHEGDITDKEINDAILSYYQSYAQIMQGNSANTPEADTENNTDAE